MEEEQKPETEVKEEVAPEQPAAEQEVKEERPEANWKAEVERKNRELERMREELSRREVQEKKTYNPNDITTWPDHELKALLKDPQFTKYHDQAEDILFDRKMEVRLVRREEASKRVSAEMQLREKFPDALDANSELAVRMEKIIQENDLSKTPAGRLVAAKLAAAELNQGKSSADARGRKIEKDRVASVKSQMVDGDRPKPTSEGQNLDSKRKELADSLMDSKHEEKQVDAVSKLLSDRGLSREKFFGK